MKNTLLVFGLMIWAFFSYAQIIVIPDAKFKNVLVNTPCVDTNDDGIGDRLADGNYDGEIDINEANKIKGLIINNKLIDSLDGVEYFTSLERLECNSNNLTKLFLSGLPKLIYLHCQSNQLFQLSLSNLPSLRYLYCNENNLTELEVSSLPSITTLNCSSNKIHNLILYDVPQLFQIFCQNNLLTQLLLSDFLRLYKLNCQNNFLTNLSLTNLPKLESIHCTSNQLTILTLSNLPSLQFLECSKNNLTQLSLFDLPSLQGLGCVYNNLDQLLIPNLPSLIALNCSYNQLTQLTIYNLPELQTLYCSQNQLTQLSLSNLPTLDYLDCSYNQLTQLTISDFPLINSVTFSENPLTHLFAKFGKAKSPIFSVIGPPTLNYICTDEFNFNFFKNKYPTANINSYCFFSPGGKYYLLIGKSTADANNNGCDINDVIFPNLEFNISSTNGDGSLLTNNSGNYFIPVKDGTHTIKPILENPDYFNVSPDSITVNFPSTSDTIIQDFCITPKNVLRQIDLSIIPLTPPARPGFDASYKVVMSNKGNQVENGTLYFAYDEAKMDFITTDVNPSTQGDGLLSWNFISLLPFETRYYNVTLNVNSPSETPPVNAGDELLITCNILDNVFLLKQEVVGSYDPNDKTCLAGKTITPEQVGEYVHYLIRFENTGNYAAENVVVKDVIDESTFDISTIQITDASHEAWARINANIVEFIFENIQLPFDDASNDGYICFKIKTKSTLVLGNELKNEANIYFDYNLPILTNKTNTVVAIPVGTDEAIGASDIEIFPNPVSDVLKFSGDDKILKVEIFDMSGRLVQVSSVVDSEFNVENLLCGIYNAKLFNSSGIINKRFTKI